jgi:hypothetical protein
VDSFEANRRLFVTVESTCQRSRDRKRVLMNATIIGADVTQVARVMELTAAGARIACDRRLDPDSDVIFKRPDAFVAARVVWSDERGAGLEFYRAKPLLQAA